MNDDVFLYYTNNQGESDWIVIEKGDVGSGIRLFVMVRVYGLKIVRITKEAPEDY